MYKEFFEKQALKERFKAEESKPGAWVLTESPEEINEYCVDQEVTPATLAVKIQRKRIVELEHKLAAKHRVNAGLFDDIKKQALEIDRLKAQLDNVNSAVAHLNNLVAVIE